MVISILNDCLLLRNKDPEELRQYLQSINIKIFDTLFSKLDPLVAKQTVLFILCAYSEDSPLQVLRQDSREEKIGICDFLDIPEFLRSNLFNLSDPDVRRSVTTYLNQFAGPIYKSWQFLKIQAQDLENDIINRAFATRKEDNPNSDAEEEEVNEAPNVVIYWDIKEHFKAVKQHTELCKQIDAIEKVIHNQVKKMEGIEEMANFTDKAKKSGKIMGGRRGNVEGFIINKR